VDLGRILTDKRTTRRFTQGNNFFIKKAEIYSKKYICTLKNQHIAVCLLVRWLYSSSSTSGL